LLGDLDGQKLRCALESTAGDLRAVGVLKLVAADENSR
jgi:hypothetical protein